MTFSLTMLLETIAADRKVAKPDAWVEKLKLHSEITEEAQAFTLTHDSNIADSLEEQQLEPWEYYAYVEMDSTAYPEQIEDAQDDRYIRIVGFDSLEASAFLHLLRELYYENNPMVEDFQVYHLFKNIHLTLRDEDGNTLDYTQDNTVDPEVLDLNKCLSYTD